MRNPKTRTELTRPRSLLTVIVFSTLALGLASTSTAFAGTISVEAKEEDYAARVVGAFPAAAEFTDCCTVGRTLSLVTDNMVADIFVSGSGLGAMSVNIRHPVAGLSKLFSKGLIDGVTGALHVEVYVVEETDSETIELVTNSDALSQFRIFIRGSRVQDKTIQMSGSISGSLGPERAESIIRFDPDAVEPTIVAKAVAAGGGGGSIRVEASFGFSNFVP